MKDNRGNMNNYVVGIDIGEKESVVIYMSPSGDTLDHISFEMNDNGYNQFRRKVPSEARIAFEASGLAPCSLQQAEVVWIFWSHCSTSEYQSSASLFDTEYANPDAANAILVTLGISDANSPHPVSVIWKLNWSSVSPTGER
ncbi:MAG: hypothetical protein M0Z77_02820 [Thermoplasmatales archaeon]|nr:hypothetical protein [Thermoplasmatales archaeon]